MPYAPVELPAPHARERSKTAVRTEAGDALEEDERDERPHTPALGGRGAHIRPKLDIRRRRRRCAMGRTHHFHVEDGDHSITVTVRAFEIEVAVDGGQVLLQRVSGTGTSVLVGELPGRPPRPFRILVRRSRLGSGIPGARWCAAASISRCRSAPGVRDAGPDGRQGHSAAASAAPVNAAPSPATTLATTFTAA
ncbi:hypothetical protein NKH77_02405 [Streptomyces sp. M19]